jgi:hypothetical protein
MQPDAMFYAASRAYDIVTVQDTYADYSNPLQTCIEIVM